ncbi:hypothetical protein [Tateyamaria pelophila]|uniref:hypothetical protein n=1 Tax=Tateyamaria pelophila TaxID=328415 RepID=UPI001CBE56C8|nr:hypothetical protein [Tateyamaria pelophila]
MIGAVVGTLAGSACPIHEQADHLPGHGSATDLPTATRDTHDYLVNMRTQIGALINEGGDIIDAPKIDQFEWAHLKQFDSLSGRNAQAAFEEMEWE